MTCSPTRYAKDLVLSPLAVGHASSGPGYRRPMSNENTAGFGPSARQTTTSPAPQRFVVFGDESLEDKTRQSGAELLPLSDARGFDIPGGPAVTRTVYITHPANPRVLVPFAEYDDKLAQDKLNEALRIFNALRASHAIAKAYRGSTRWASATGKSTAAGGKGVAKSKSNYDVAYEQVGTGGRPSDPRPLTYPQEPGFEAACEAVLRNGARRMRIEISRESQFSLNGSIGKRFAKFGLELGATIGSEQVSNFVVEATFGKESIAEAAPVARAADSEGLAGRFNRRK